MAGIIDDDDDDEVRRFDNKDDFVDEDDSDESTEIEIEEHVDEIDEGYFTPSVAALVFLTIVVLAVAGLMGYLIHYAYEERNESPSAARVIPSPSEAPTVLDLRDDAFICDICPGGNITLLDGILDIDGSPTCKQMQKRGENGQVTGEQCRLLQDAASTKCGCTVAPSSCTVCTTGVVRNPNGILNVSSAGFPGITELSCAQLDGFAQSGRIPEDFCPALQEASAEVCDCGCNICGEGVITKADGVVNVTAAGITNTSSMTCEQLMVFAKNESISNEVCTDLQAAALGVCKCSAAPDTCSICRSGEIGNPEGTVKIDGESLTCAQLAQNVSMGEINADQCSAAQSVAAEGCGCTIGTKDQQVLDLLATVVGQGIFQAGTPEYAAGQYLIHEDPVYNGGAIVVRRLEPSDTEESNENKTMPVFAMPATVSLDIACPICPNGTEISNYEGTLPADSLPEAFADLGAVNCSELERLSFEDKIAEDACPSIQKLSEDACGCDIRMYKPSGSMSGGEEESGIGFMAPEVVAIIQRYLMILFYYQTSNITESPWRSGCDPESSNPCKIDGEEAGQWLSDSSECEWGGITCEEGIVKGIELVGFGLSGKFPSAVFFLGDLNSLDLFGNKLQGPLPSNITELTALEYLNVNGNQLTGDIPAGIFEMPKLVAANLGGGGEGGNNLSGSFDCRISRNGTLPEIGIDCATVTCDCCTCCVVDHGCLDESEAIPL